MEKIHNEAMRIPVRATFRVEKDCKPILIEADYIETDAKTLAEWFTSQYEREFSQNKRPRQM